MIRVCPSCHQKNRVGAAHAASATRCGKCKTALGAIDRPIDADLALFEDIRLHAPVRAVFQQPGLVDRSQMRQWLEAAGA